MTTPGHERWHPAPEFYYQPGGGPLFDMGPYYLTALVVLLGPVRRVSGAAGASQTRRTIGSGPRAGAIFPVEVKTHVAGTLEFADGAIVTLVMSFDVWSAHLPRFEIYGTRGSLSGPDPNGFGGPVGLFEAGGREWAEVRLRESGRPQTRGLGLADLVAGVAEGRPHRAGAELGYHVLEIMSGLLESAETGHHVTLTSTCERPDPV
jgi:predicted dehydrogenase